MELSQGAGVYRASLSDSGSCIAVRAATAAVVESGAGPSISLTLAQVLPRWARMMPAKRFASRASSASRMDSCSSTALSALPT